MDYAPLFALLSGAENFQLVISESVDALLRLLVLDQQGLGAYFYAHGGRWSFRTAKTQSGHRRSSGKVACPGRDGQ
jgi:hypothetical protein